MRLVIALGGNVLVKRGEAMTAGIEAVIDKDRASELLARQLKADMLLLLTDVDAVYRDFGEPTARAIAIVGARALQPDQFAAGSMGPKIEAATRFAQATDGRAAIGRLQDAAAILQGKAGTTIVAGDAAIEFR